MRGTVVDLTSMSPDNTRELNQIAQNLRKTYTEFIDSLSISYGEEPFWWDTPLVSRNPHICACFYDICLLKLALNIIDREHPHVLVVPKQQHKKAIEKNVTRYMPKIIVAEGFKSRIKRRIVAKYSYYSFRRYIENLQEPDCSAMQKFQGRNLTLASSPMIPFEIKDGKYTSRYYPGLLDYSSTDVVLLLHFTFDKLQNRIKSYVPCSILVRKDLLFFEQYADMSAFKEIEDYTRWCRHFRVDSCLFDGMEVGELLNDALVDGGQDITAMKGILWGRSICRLVEQYDLKINCLIDWYEGQSSSNAMIRRFREKFPDVPTVACSHFPYGENWLSLFPSERQVEKKVVPEYFSLMGKAWENQIHQFSKDVKCIATPSFRHSKIFEMEMQENLERKGVLLVLPYFTDVATQMLRAFGEATRGMEPASIGPVYIKNHPTNQNFRLSDYGIEDALFRNWDVFYLNGDLFMALHGKKVAILSKTTSTLEVMLSGAYTINFIPAGDLTAVSLPKEVESKVTVAYNADDLRSCLITSKRGLSWEEINSLRESSFTKVNHETVADFLALRTI